MPLRGRTNADRALHVLCISVAFWVRGGPSASLRVRFLCEQFFGAPPQEEVIQGAAARIIVTTSDTQRARDRGHNHRQFDRLVTVAFCLGVLLFSELVSGQGLCDAHLFVQVSRRRIPRLVNRVGATECFPCPMWSLRRCVAVVATEYV